jgi:hypothetical protein
MPSTPIACHLVLGGRGKLPIRGGGADGRVGRADGILVVIGKKEIAPQAESARHCTLGVPSCGGGREASYARRRGGGWQGQASGMTAIGKREIAPQAESTRHLTLGVLCGEGVGMFCTRGSSVSRHAACF